MKNLKFNFMLVGLMLLSLGSMAQSTTITVREAYKTSYGTTYWVNTYPSTSTYIAPTIKPSVTPTPNNSWMNVYSPTEVAGDKNYEVDLHRSLELFNKKNKTGDEYKEMNQLAYRWDVIYKRPKDARLRLFYRYHSDGVLRLCNIFGDEPMGLIEAIEKGY